MLRVAMPFFDGDGSMRCASMATCDAVRYNAVRWQHEALTEGTLALAPRDAAHGNDRDMHDGDGDDGDGDDGATELLGISTQQRTLQWAGLTQTRTQP